MAMNIVQVPSINRFVAISSMLAVNRVMQVAHRQVSETR
jgi:hypothetical protein